MVKNLPASAGDLSLVPASKDALEEEMATHGKASVCNAGDLGSIPGYGRSSREVEKGMAIWSSILAWRIPWMEEPGGLQSTGSQRVGHD